MPSRVPNSLKGFEQHGVHMRDSAGESQWTGDCPFCGKVNHFYMNVQARLWDCKTCLRSGNYQQYLKLVCGRNGPKLDGHPLYVLSKQRGLKKSTLRAWHVGWDGGQYTIPIVGVDGKLTDVLRHNRRIGTQSTAKCKTGIAGLDKLTETSTIYLCEGVWDGMAMWESLKRLNKPGCVLAIPGVGTFKQEWCPHFKGKQVICVMDNDDPGKLGDRRVYEMLNGIASELWFTHWSEKLPIGFDFRALYLAEGKQALRHLGKMIHKEPRLYPIRIEQAAEVVKDELTGKGIPAEDLIERYRKWLHITDPDVIDIIFGAVLANRIEGDPLWLLLVGPSGGCKTELLMALDGAPLIVSLTSLTPHSLLSGSQSPGGGDPSLIPKLNGRVLTIKDFTTLLTMNQVARDEIFGILRDAYDGRTEKAFGTGLIRSYSCLFGLIAGVTPAIDMFGTLHGSLGERFLKYRIRHAGGIVVSSKKSIRQAMKNISHEFAMRAELCSVAKDALNFKVEEKPEISEEVSEAILGMAQWVAALRTPVVRERYTSDIAYKPSPEVGTRLAKQLTKLCMGICLFRKEEEITPKILALASRVARDTIPGSVEMVVRHLYIHREEEEFFSTKQVSGWCQMPEETVKRVLDDLSMLGVVKRRTSGFSTGFWALSKTIVRITRPLGIFREEESWQKVRKEN